MLARCPACAQRFPVVGNCETACPFCDARVQICVQREVGAPSAAGRTEAREASGRLQGAAITFETLALPVVEDKISNLSAPWPVRDGPPPAPPPSLGRPQLRWLMYRPARFFGSLERGRPQLGPAVGALPLAGAAAVQALSWAQIAPVAIDPRVALGAGLAVALTLPLFLFGVYRLGVRALQGPVTARRRTVAVLGYGFVPMLLGLVPFGGLGVAVAVSAAAHARGLQLHLGLPVGAARGLVGLTWLVYGSMAWGAFRGMTVG